MGTFFGTFSLVCRFFECLVLSDICCVFLELLLISNNFTYYSVVVRFGPTMEFFLRLLPLSSIFGEMFYHLFRIIFSKTLLNFFGTFLHFSGMFYSFFELFGVFFSLQNFFLATLQPFFGTIVLLFLFFFLLFLS